MNEDEQYSKLLIDNHCIFLQIREYQRCCSYPARAYGFILGCWWEAVLVIFLVFCVVLTTLNTCLNSYLQVHVGEYKNKITI
jgi:hypothetical protein